MRDLPTLLDRLEEAGGPADPVPSADGWELVLAESVAYLVDDQRRWHALDELRRVVGLQPEQILAAPCGARTRPAPAAPSPVTARAPVIRRPVLGRPEAGLERASWHVVLLRLCHLGTRMFVGIDNLLSWPDHEVSLRSRLGW